MSPPQTCKEIISKHLVEFHAMPARIPSTSSVDGPLLGNGDMTVAIGGGPGRLEFHLGKNDLWRLQHGNQNANPVPFGRLRITTPAMEAEDVRLSQDLFSAVTTGVFRRLEGSLGLSCYVAATENVLVIELEGAGQSVRIHPDLVVAGGRGCEWESGCTAGVVWGRRAFVEEVDIASGAAAAFIVLGAEQEADGGFILEPGRAVTVVLAMTSLMCSESYVDDAVAHVSRVALPSALPLLRKAHEDWWHDYWERGYVDIGDPVIEKQYYLSLYGMACCSRDPDFPPPIFGWTTSDTPEWNGDYHLNYNHQAPFYGLARANRLEQADPHDAPLLDFLDRGRWHCQAIFGFDGVVYPVGIGPKGIETTYGIDLADEGEVKRVEHGCFLLGQRTNAAYGIVNMAARWHATLDEDYAARILPYVREVATFWENYVTWDSEGSRFIIENDSCHESSGPDLNSCLSLALVRTTLELAIELTQTLNCDTERCSRWAHILRHLSPYSTQQRDGKTVFRYCEQGTAWRDSNTIGIQHIYPGGQIHLDSDPHLVEVARNTIEVMQRWQDSNGANSFFPAAVRVGCDPEQILSQLREYSKNTWPNGFRAGNPHAIENWSTVPNTIHEMLCMDQSGVIRVFAVWPRDRDAWFRHIRCRGAFLVSAQLKDREVQYVEIISEKGQSCTLENPWPDAEVRVDFAAGPARTCSGSRICLPIEAGDFIRLTRDGD